MRNLKPLKEVPASRDWTTERYLRRLVAERRIPFYKAGGKVLLDLDELDQYVENNRVEPEPRTRR
jgi:excisionase family DNA binding protein